MRVYPLECSCGIDDPATPPWGHAIGCPILLHWELYDLARYIEASERKQPPGRTDAKV